MEIVIAEDYAALSRTVAERIAEQIRLKPNAAIVWATGNTPMGTYAELAAMRERGELEASGVRAFQLDEYMGIGLDDPRSLYGWMKRSLLDPLHVPEDHVVRLRGDAPQPAIECERYERALESVGGFDLAVLGLGPNGHLGFNEPPSDPLSPVRVVSLTPESVRSNAGYWGGEDRVPRKALTAGLRSLLGSRRILLLVSGAQKAQILRRTVEGAIGADVPASYLQRSKGVTVVADRAASDLLAPSPSRASVHGGE